MGGRIQLNQRNTEIRKCLGFFEIHRAFHNNCMSGEYRLLIFLSNIEWVKFLMLRKIMANKSEDIRCTRDSEKKERKL